MNQVEQITNYCTWVRVSGDGFCVSVQMDDDDDREIVRLALEMGERRRYGMRPSEEAPNG